MKKKLLSILVALIVCISPLFFAVGCSTDNDSGVAFPDNLKTGWSVVEGSDDWLDCTHSGKTWYQVEGSIEYYTETFDPNLDKDGDGVAEGGMVKSSSKSKILVSEAVRQGLLTCISGFNSSKMLANESTRTMILMFDMTQIEITYTVTSNGSTNPAKHNYTDTNEDGKCDQNCGKPASDKSVHN